MRHRNVLYRTLFLTTIFCAAGPSAAAETTVSGFFNDSTNTALVSSNGANDLGPAQFGTDDNVARNIAIYQLVVPNDNSQIQFNSSGYYTGGMGAGDNSGAQPYFSIFSGNGPTATFVDSSYFDPNIDFSVAETLAAGTYLFTIGVYENLSIAENDGPPYGSLSEGFTALGEPGLLGDDFYQVSVTSDGDPFTVEPAGPLGSTGPTEPNQVPEPSAAALLGVGVAAFVGRRRRRAPTS